MSDFESVWNILIPPVEITDGRDEIANPVAQLFERAQLESTLSKSADDDWDEEINVPVQKTTPTDGALLEKTYSSMRQSHSRTSIAQFIQKSLAVGETIDSLADYAQQHDQETADMIRAVASELGY